MAGTYDPFGFRCSRGGAHGARTMMRHELDRLLACVPDEHAPAEAYRQAVVEDNCLGKKSGKSRQLSFRHLEELYGLDPALILFRGLRYFWKRDEAARPLLALLCAYARDRILRDSASFILNLQPGEAITRDDMEIYLETEEPGRYSSATRRSIAQNINGTWTQAGHLKGRVRKERSRVHAPPGSIACALMLGFLKGGKGSQLFSTEYVQILDASPTLAIEQAEIAAQRGWLRFNRIGDIMEIDFPALIQPQDRASIREQN